MNSPKRIAIVGSGPAGLMAATQLSLSSQANQLEIHFYEKRAGLGRKLLIAGSSGLNISHQHSITDFAQHYEGWDISFWNQLLTQFGAHEWIKFIEDELKLETFLGTSQRYFVREMKASSLLKKWTQFLEARGVIIHSSSELTDFSLVSSLDQKNIHLFFNHEPTAHIFHSAAFFLGGASWETEEPSWVKLFKSKNITLVPFEASNVGYEVDWNEKFLIESEGKPLKKIELQTKHGKKIGELMITRYGLEGTPIYFCGVSGNAFLDLKPDLNHEQILKKLLQAKENFSPMRRVKHYLNLGEAAESLLFHYTENINKHNLVKFIEIIKRFPITLKNPRPLSESISSKGGVSLNEISKSLELKKFPGIYCGGEMLDWDAPTGGFLIQACVSQGAFIAKNQLTHLSVS